MNYHHEMEKTKRRCVSKKSCIIPHDMTTNAVKHYLDVNTT